MGKSSELTTAFNALHKEFKAKVKQQLLPLLEKQLAAHLDDTITEFRFGVEFLEDKECSVCDIDIKIAEPEAPKTVLFKVNEEVWIEELKAKATIKEINGRTFKVHITMIDTIAEMPKEYITKLYDENKIERDEEGFTWFGEEPDELRNRIDKINDMVQDIDPQIYFALFKGIREEVTVYVSKKGIKTK